MKQIIQHMGSGETELIEVPAPQTPRAGLLIHTTASLVSAGTERMLVDFGQANLLAKARQQPDKVRQVLDKVRTDGLVTTVDAVRSKLAQPIPLGYCNVGTVVAVGADVEGFIIGDRVVSNGPHAEVVRVPRNLAAKVPDGVSDEAASFAVVAAIGLQGIRLAAPTLGEAVVVTGAGLIGLLTIQLLRAHGTRVLAIDFDEDRLALARSFGAETCNPSTSDPVAAGMAFSRGRGVDAVLITASTSSSDPVTQAARMSRKRGRIVLIGVTGLELSRADFYEKELSFQVSCSYGPGRYDPDYEDRGQDYPYGFVRWTEQRNFEAVLDMMADGRVEAAPLVTHRFAIDEAVGAYKVLTESKAALGIVLAYPREAAERQHRQVALADVELRADAPVLGVIGAGNYASRVLLPAFKAAGAQFGRIATSGSVAGVVEGRKLGFASATSDLDTIFDDAAVNTVVIATRHDTHSALASRALDAGKHVFVEKPLGLDQEQVNAVEAAFGRACAQHGGRQLMVGFNRRFAPTTRRMHALLDAVVGPKSFVFTMNAGAIPATHWTQDPAVGGGRIIGEACHHIDLMRFLCGHPIVSIYARRMGDAPGVETPDDKAAIVLGFADGSFGTIHYLANGGSVFPKERIEVFADGGVLQIDNFRALRGYGWRGFSQSKSLRQNKGQQECAQAFLSAIGSGVPAIPPAEIFEVARATLDAADQLRRQ